MRHALMPIAVIALLAGCGERSDDTPPPDAVPNEKGEAAVEPVSIIRDDVRAEAGVDDVEEAAPTRLVVGFPEGGAELGEEALAALEQFVAGDWVAGDEPVLLWGHSDTIGSDAANFRAGEARAEAVADYLEGKGVARERITIVSLGEGNPTEPNYLPDGSDNAEGQAANRRVEIKVGAAADEAGEEKEDPVKE